MKKLWVFTLTIFFCSEISSQKNFNLGLVSQVKHPVESNDIWGYVDPDGIEYAVIGTEVDCRIYQLKDPANPVLISTIAGARSIWRDFKSYRQYIYQITQRGTDGLLIIDMTDAPETVSSVLFQGEITIGKETSKLETCHNLYIDTEQGLAFLAGCNIGNGGVLIFDIATDPMQPRFLGAEDFRYSHDVVTKGDTLFSSEINEGNLGIYDISDITNPVLVSRTQTSSIFTHNAWYSDNGHYIFTTDERANAYVDAYDIREIESPIRIDQYRPHDDQNIIPHNTHYLNGFLITSWYTEGVIILDAHRPDNLVKVGQYDTYSPDRVGYEGAWGAYPFLPSGLVLVSDLAGGLFVLEPQYERASYLEGEVVDDKSGAPINAALIRLNDTDGTTENSKANGIFKTGTAEGGNYEVTVSHPDYESQTFAVSLTTGEVTEATVRLVRKDALFTVAGHVTDPTGRPIDNAQLLIQSPTRSDATSTDINGFYQAVVVQDKYEFYVAAWGFKGKLVTRQIQDQILEPIILEPGYEDDFFADLGWTVSGDARKGIWERAIPKPTFLGGEPANATVDLDTDIGEYCYVTGNDDRSVGADDVDDGITILTSPLIDVNDKKNAIIEISPWFFNGGGESIPNDTMKIYLLADGERTLTHFLTNNFLTNSRWISPPLKIFVDSINRRASEVQIQIEISDQPNTGHIVEGGIDRFRMYEGPLPTYPAVQESIEVIVSPNPNDGFFFIDARTNQELVKINVYDISGRLVYSELSPGDEVNLKNIPSGSYVIDILFSSGLQSQQKFQKF